MATAAAAAVAQVSVTVLQTCFISSGPADREVRFISASNQLLTSEAAGIREAFEIVVVGSHIGTLSWQATIW